MRRILPLLLLVVCAAAGFAQPCMRLTEGAVSPRTEFVSYATRPDAEAGAREKSKNYTPLIASAKCSDGNAGVRVYTVTLNTQQWLEREVFLRVAAGAPYTVYAGGRKVGCGDGPALAEFDISSSVAAGACEITVEMGCDGHNVPGRLHELYACSQPRVRIEDYCVSAPLKGAYGYLCLDVALANGYNYDEPVSVGYDIYSPEGKLLYYDKRPAALAGGGRDTLRFEYTVPQAAAWSPFSPALYKAMLILWHGSRIMEYIPFNVGFTPPGSEYILAIIRKAAKENKLVSYSAPFSGNPAADREKARADMAGLRGRVVEAASPQPQWFYDMCDRAGVYVVDRAGIDYPAGSGMADDPRMLPVFTERVRSMYFRGRNHVCIAAWSPAPASAGNGYNMYKCYQWLKAASPDKPVIYRGAGDEWNNDLK